MAATLGAISFSMLARIGESPSEFRFFATKNAEEAAASPETAAHLAE
ncbi:MAG TPA: hypothetical protein VKU03_05520 [Roseiarcus sp.]|nr:hypothetical protein [Roseiarcus sp.]